MRLQVGGQVRHAVEPERVDPGFERAHVMLPERNRRVFEQGPVTGAALGELAGAVVDAGRDLGRTPLLAPQPDAVPGPRDQAKQHHRSHAAQRPAGHEFGGDGKRGDIGEPFSVELVQRAPLLQDEEPVVQAREEQRVGGADSEAVFDAALRQRQGEVEPVFEFFAVDARGPDDLVLNREIHPARQQVVHDLADTGGEPRAVGQTVLAEKIISHAVVHRRDAFALQIRRRSSRRPAAPDENAECRTQVRHAEEHRFSRSGRRAKAGSTSISPLSKAFTSSAQFGFSTMRYLRRAAWAKRAQSSCE